MTDHDDHREDFGRDPALDAIGNALEGRAEALRREPDAGFESRVLRASHAALRTGAELRFVVDDPTAQPRPRRRRAALSRAVAIAAVLALALTAGIFSVMASRPSPVVPARVATTDASDLLDELDAWLGLHDEHFADARLVSLRSEIDSASTGTGADIFDPEEWM